ncbi:MAG: hypothetical protein K7J46_17245, partial [Bryobacter sp.]|nr:hypothetical protein [Bryobacter sp. CoA8 C33]
MKNNTDQLQISSEEIDTHLEATSDFAFELKCLKLMRTLGWRSQHGGTYRDPVTDKSREFDIRAEQWFESRGVIGSYGKGVLRMAPPGVSAAGNPGRSKGNDFGGVGKWVDKLDRTEKGRRTW